MGHLSFFNYITGITIGSIAANVVTMESENFYGELINLTWWCALTILLDIISLKIPISRVILAGEPTIIVKKGNIIKKALKKTRMTIDNLSMLLREEGIFSFKEVEYAILESNGEITVYKKEDMHSVIRKDVNIKNPKPKYMPCELIVDGIIIKKNLQEYDLTIDWLNTQLKKHGVKSKKDVLYAELQTDGNVNIYKNDNN